MSETVNKVAVLSSAVKHALLADVQYYDFHASSAFNRKMKGIITPGFYGGFEPALAGGLNLKITSLQGPGGHGVASVDVNNHQITVQQIEDVTLAIPVNGVTRVMLEANYQYGVKTSQVDDSSDIHAARIFTANISVPLADNHLEICRVTVPADATELTLDMIDSSHRKNKALGITLSGEIDSDADHIGASSHAVKKAVKAARDETEKQIEELVDGAPASLDTLKKIADAINNDPDFFNTLAAILNLKAPLESPELTGIPTVPTPPLSVSNKQVANTEYVQAAVAALVGSSPEALDTLAELAQALGNDPNFATTMLNALAGKQPLNEALTALSGLSSAANKLAYFNGRNSMALANLTAVGRVLIGQESVSKVIEYLGLVETINLAKNALPLSGGRLTGPVSLVNENGKRLQIETAGNPTSNVFVIFTGTDERPCLIEFKDETSYHFFSQRNPDGTITFQAAGKMIPLDYSNFDAKYQAKGNYAVKGDSYTKEETNLKFENEKISGVGPFSFLDKTSSLILKAAGVTFATEGDRVTFPEAFPNVCRAVVLTLNGSAGETTRNIVATNVSRTGFSIARGNNEAGVFWMAIGV